MILGIDEVGRGPWAGPLVVGAVVLADHIPEGLTDSKKIIKSKHLGLAKAIKEESFAWSLGWVHSEELDEVGLSRALELATLRAVEGMELDILKLERVIIDGTSNFLKSHPLAQLAEVLPKADLLEPSVSAASIIAKQARDAYMTEWAKVYPAYGFDTNAGYGVAKHKEAIELHGVTPLHRRSFAPIRKYLASN